MIYYFWANQNRYDFLKNSGYHEKECQSMDREILIVETEKKEFEVTHKHAVDLKTTFFSEDVAFCIGDK